MVLGAKARAVLKQRQYVAREDILALAAPVLRHRIQTNFNAEAEGVTTDNIVERLIEFIPQVPDTTDGGKLPQVFRSAGTG